jgi:hypothetical protein
MEIADYIVLETISPRSHCKNLNEGIPMKRPFVSMCIVILLTTTADADPPKNPKDSPWSVTGIQTARPGGVLGHPSHLDGTSVTCRLDLPNQFITGIDDAKSSVAITDNKGTNLVDNAEEMQRNSVNAEGISTDGKRAVLIFRAAKLPEKEAKKIRIKGKVVISVGKNEKSIERKGVSLAKPIDLEFGTMRPGGNVERSLIRLLVFQGTHPLKNFVLLNAEDKEVAVRHTSRFLADRKDQKSGESRPFFTSIHPVATLNFNAKVDRWTVRMTYFESVERIEIPIDLEVGLGI